MTQHVAGQQFHRCVDDQLARLTHSAVCGILPGWKARHAPDRPARGQGGVRLGKLQQPGCSRCDRGPPLTDLPEEKGKDRVLGLGHHSLDPPDVRHRVGGWHVLHGAHSHPSDA